MVDASVSAEILPYVWRIPGNVSVEARKMRRRVELLPGEALSAEDHCNEQGTSETIGQAKTLTVRQFYYIYCFLSGAEPLRRGEVLQVSWACTDSEVAVQISRRVRRIRSASRARRHGTGCFWWRLHKLRDMGV